MRQIKFRAWDGKRMTTSGISFNNSTSCLETPIGAQMKLMQFTGLTDKNGVEIYESDCFVLPRVKAKDEYLGTVAFDSDLGCFLVNESNGGWSLLYNFMTDNKTAFIGGNQFENPELLK